MKKHTFFWNIHSCFGLAEILRQQTHLGARPAQPITKLSNYSILVTFLAAVVWPSCALGVETPVPKHRPIILKSGNTVWTWFDYCLIMPSEAAWWSNDQRVIETVMKQWLNNDVKIIAVGRHDLAEWLNLLHFRWTRMSLNFNDQLIFK